MENKKQIRAIKKAILKSGLYDEAFYSSQFGENMPKGDLLEYYILNGHKENKSPGYLFDNQYYLIENPDVRAAEINPLYHYIMFGQREGRAIRNTKDETLYLRWCERRRNQKNIKARLKAFKDILVILKSGMFDGPYYLEQNNDVCQYLKKTKMWNMRLSKNPLFSIIGRAFTTPVIHYIKQGMYEDRNPSRDFSTSYYMNTNPDLLNGPYLTPFVHYIKYGKAEGRKGNRGLTGYSAFADIWESRKNSKNTDKLTLSVISLENQKPEISYSLKKYVTEYNDVNTAINNSTGDAIWICSHNSLNDDDRFVSKAMSILENQAVYAVVRDNNENPEEITFLSYKAFGTKKELLQGKYYNYSDIIMRNPKSFTHKKAVTAIAHPQDYTLLMLRAVTGGEIAEIREEECTSLYSDKLEYFTSLAKILINNFTNSTEECEYIYKTIRAAASKKGISYQQFAENAQPSTLIKALNMNIMIGIYAFTFGGGEIMPIRLANKLYSMGYNVTVHALLEREQDKRVRNMLLPDIPVVYGEDKGEIALYLREFKIQTYSSHHQAVQQRVSEAIDEYPELKEKILNVGTSHGMYENMDETSLSYLLTETNLMENTDYWTYVADKNTKPFEKYKLYNKNTFVKISNGMIRPQINKADLSAYGIKENSFVACVVSRAIIQKGWLNAINAVTEARSITGLDIHLLLIGAGEVYDEYAQKLGNEFIHFLGFIENPCDYLAASDLCMLPSYYASESAPVCLIEAMMCGKPSIASNIGDVCDMLEYNGNYAGDVFDLENMQVNDRVLTQKLVNMVTDKTFYNACAENAIKKSQFFDIDNIIKMYLAVYNNYYTKTGITNDVIPVTERLNASNRLLANAQAGTDAPLVSVIVPNYNHSAFLRKRLDCIYNQTYKNIQVILMDDCSKDNSREILKEYAQKYPEISIECYNRDNSGGVFYQWAKGVNNSTGSLCWIAESDDYCEENFLEEVVPAFSDPQVKISYCKYCFVDENDNKNENGFFNYVGYIDKEKWHNSYVNDAQNEVDTALGIINTIPNASGAVFRKPVNNPVFQDEAWYKMKICGDWIFYLHLLKGGKVAYSVNTTSYFRFHSNNSSAKTYTNSTYYTEHEKVASTIRQLFHVDRDVIERNHSKIEKFYFDHIDGTKEDFNKLYNVDRAMIWYPDFKGSEQVIEKQREKYNAQYETVVINPIKSATDAADISFEKKMEFIGNNTGNMLFVSAVKEQVNYKSEIWFNGFDLNRLEQQGNVSAIIPASNFIIAGSDNLVDSMRAMYEKTTCPITMVGLGAQAYAPYNTPRKLVERLSENKISFFKMAAERAVSLGIRGEFTAECLEIMGIKNYRIIGCPTCYKYFDGIYKELKKPTANKPIFTITGKNKGESGIFEFGMKNNATLLMQMITEFPQLLYGVDDIDDELFNKNFPEINVSKEDFIKFIKSNGKIFFDMDKWNSYMQEQDFTFSFGSRFHGNMSALRNGIPALWVTHDSRTSELVQTLKLPHITLSEFNEINNMKKLVEYCDYTEFYKSYKGLSAEYVKFLDENNLNHKFTV